MYEKTLNLKQRPFTTATTAEQWCETGNAGNALRQLIQTIDRKSGIAVVVAGPGMGKSLLLEMLSLDASGKSHEVIPITVSRLDQRRDVLQRILFELNVNCREMSESDLRLMLIHHFRSVCGQNGRDVVLLVDEAQSLGHELLDELRIICESGSRNRGRCHLVLAGTARLDELLNHVGLEQLIQRIACRVYLAPMSHDETAEYVRQHLSRAGGGRREYFTADALREIAVASGGIPRLINQLCDQCLLILASGGQKAVSREMVADAWCDVQGLPRKSPAIELATQSREESKKTARKVVPPAGSSARTSTTNKPASANGPTVEFGTLDDEPMSEPRPKRKAERTSQTAAQAVPMMEEIDRLRKELHEALEKTSQKSAKESGSRARAADNPFAEEFDSEETVHVSRHLPAQPAPTRAAPDQAWSVSDSIEISIADFGTTLRPRALSAAEMADFPGFSTDSIGHLESQAMPAKAPQQVPRRAGSPAAKNTSPMTLPIHAGSSPGNNLPSGPSGEAGADDDRDILISGTETLFEPTTDIEAASGEAAELAEGEPLLKGPHNSRAVRMDYRQLFSQLRDGSTH